MTGRRHAALAAVVFGIVMLAVPPAAFPAGTKHGHRHHHKPKFVVGPGNLVAPLTIPANPHPGPVPNCRRPSIKCVANAAQRLRKVEAAFGCDHRAVFATTYRVLTQVMLKTLTDNPHFFDHMRYLYYEDALFADVYIGNTRAWIQGRRVSPAWQTNFQVAASGDLNAAQDMLLGINAHVQNDMPFVIAALGTSPGVKGGLTYSDHEKENEILGVAYQTVVDEIRRDYDPILDVTNSSLTPLDDFAGLQLVKQWREDVWTHANQLIAAKTPAERATVTTQIEQNAEQWAQEISTAGAGFPGYRSYRDSYCATNNPNA
jgi:Family of unknown function (DUF5995)